MVRVGFLVASLAGCNDVRTFDVDAGAGADAAHGGTSDADVGSPGAKGGSHAGETSGTEAGPPGSGGTHGADAANDADVGRNTGGHDTGGRNMGGGDSGGGDSGGGDSGGGDAAGREAGSDGAGGRRPVTGNGGPWTPCTSNGLELSFNPMYSAYVDDPRLTFRLPAMVNAGAIAPIVWAATDSSSVFFETTGPGTVMITTLRPGDVTIEAQWDGACGTAPLHVTEATRADWLAGKQRYDNGNPLPSVQTDPKTGLPVLPPGGFSDGVIDPPNRPPACTSCHGDKPTSSFFRAKTPDPSRIAGFSDSELEAIITEGAIPMAGYFDQSIMPQQYWSFFHRWQDIYGLDAVKAIVVYLRSLPPAPSGP